MQENIDALQDGDARDLLFQVAEREPGIIIDILAAVNVAAPVVQPAADVDWCVCTHCVEMATDRENLCCRNAENNCLSRQPVSIIFVV